MTYRGTVTNGVVKLEPGANLPEGTVVEVLAPSEVAPGKGSTDHSGEPPLSKYARLAVSADLPPDFADQHDHYIHGTPKR